MEQPPTISPEQIDEVAHLTRVAQAAKRELDKRRGRVARSETLRLARDLAVVQSHLGLLLQRDGKLDDALVWLKQAVDLCPSDGVLWRHLAALWQEMEEYAEAIPCWRRAILLTQGSCELHLGLGWALQGEGRVEEAREQYHKASALEPDSGLPQTNLGGLHEEQGEMAAAEAAFRNALRLQPKFPLPHARLATLLRGKLPETDLAALQQRLTDPELEPEPRARLLFGLAHVFDGRGEFARAAECLRNANGIAAELNRRRGGYDPDQHAQFVDMLLETFDARFFARLSGQAIDSRQPVFVVGLPRSGTTLIEHVLASHSQVHGAGELRQVRKLFEAVPAATGQSKLCRDAFTHLDADALRRLAEGHLDRLRAIDGGQSPRIVDKMPDNYLYLGLLVAMFPRATFIHCRRGLRDVAVSCWMTDFLTIRWANEQTHLAARIREHGRLMDHWRRVLPTPLHEVDYEATVADLESVARRLIAACDLAWEPACLDFHRTRRPVRTASLAQVRQPVYRGSVGRWKNYEHELAELFAALPSVDD